MTFWILDDRELQVDVELPAVTVTTPEGEEFVLHDGEVLEREDSAWIIKRAEYQK